MKKIYFLFSFFLMTGWINAQQTIDLNSSTVKKVTDNTVISSLKPSNLSQRGLLGNELTPKTMTCLDTLTYPYVKEANVGNNVFYILPINSSFGVNGVTVSQTYKTGITPLEVHGLNALVQKLPADAGSAIALKFKLFAIDATGAPTTELASTNYTVPASAGTALHDAYVYFNSPVSVTGGFAVSVETVNPADDIYVYISDDNYTASYFEGLFYLKSDVNSIPFLQYLSLSTPGNEQDFDILLFPIISYDMEAISLNFSSNPACVNTSVSISGTYSPSDAATNRFLAIDAFVDYFSLPYANEVLLLVPDLDNLDFNNSATFVYGDNMNYTYTQQGDYDVVFQYALGFSNNQCFDAKLETITVVPEVDASFSFPSNTFCTSSSNVLPSATQSGGVFTSSPSGLVVDATTGEIDFASSTEGSYTISYEVTNGVCTDIVSRTITVSSNLDASFSYGQNEYCKNDAAAQVIFSAGASAGVFTADDSGISINSSTGEIDFSNSQANTYIIMNTISPSGTCPGDVHTVTVEIKDIPTISMNIVSAICQEDDAILLDATPTGGIWSGNGVNGNEFDPSNVTTGSSTVTYSVTENGCTNTADAAIQVDEMPTIQIVSVNDLCDYNAAVTLNATPAGGSWSGDGVNGNQFDPATANLGDNEVTYTVVNGECTASSTIHIMVDECVGVNTVDMINVEIYPNPAKNYFIINAETDMVGTLSTVDGKTILSSITVTGNMENRIETLSLSKGIYLLTLSSEKNTMTKRIVIE